MTNLHLTNIKSIYINYSQIQNKLLYAQKDLWCSSILLCLLHHLP